MSIGDNKGFTLMEIIIAVAVMAILAGTIAPLAFRQLEAAKEEATRRELQAIQDAVTEYHGDTGRLPITLAGLVSDDGRAGWTGPYLGADWNDPVNQVSRDAFELDYTYALNPTVIPAGAADLIIASGGLNRSIDLLSGGSWDLSAISSVDDIVMHLSATRLNRDKQRETLRELESLAESSRRYWTDNSAFPANLSLLMGTYHDPGYLDESFDDEWGNAYLSHIQAAGVDFILYLWSTGPNHTDESGGGDDLLLSVYSSAIGP